jgi:hypothetical protein
MLRDVRTLLARRQPALVYLIALAVAGAALDLLVAAARDRLSSFSAFARVEFDGLVLWRAVGSLGHASAGVWLAVLFTVPASALVSGWLRACYLIALGEGRYALRAPWLVVGRLTAYSLLVELIGLGLAGLFDNGQAVVGLVLLLATTPVTLYADYAIVFDDVGVADGIRRSLRVFQQRLRASIVVALALVLLSEFAALAFKNGFTDSTHVQPSYLAAWLLVGVLLQFVTDAVLLTLYRGTRLSEASPAGSSAAPRSSEPSD